jgi:integrase
MHRLGTGEFIFDRPKTAKSRRLIPLGATIILALKQHRIEEMAKAQLIGWSNSDESQVFTRLDGSSMLPDTLSHQFIKRARAAGFDGLTFHALRHTHATWMLQQDIHPKIVQERLGHASMSTTLDTYSHVVPGLQQAAAVQFDTLIQKASIKTEPVLAH